MPFPLGFTGQAGKRRIRRGRHSRYEMRDVVRRFAVSRIRSVCGNGQDRKCKTRCLASEFNKVIGQEVSYGAVRLCLRFA